MSFSSSPSSPSGRSQSISSNNSMRSETSSNENASSGVHTLASTPSSTLSSVACCVTVGLFQGIIFIFDLLTYPFSLIFEQPWDRIARAERIRATRENLALGDSPYYRIGEQNPYDLKSIKTIPEAQRITIQGDRGASDRKALGYRLPLEVRLEFCAQQKKKLKKFVLSDYIWMSPLMVDEQILTLELALRNLGIKLGENVLIYSETRYEWFVTAHAVFRIGAAVATLYANLGIDGVEYGVRDTKGTIIFTSEDLAKRLPPVLPDQIKTLVYFPSGGNKRGDIEAYCQKQRIRPFDFEAFKELGRKNAAGAKSDFNQIVETMPAVILYTSGSTGKPKGVVLTHKNFIAGVKAVLTLFPDEMVRNAQKEAYFAYLPLAHILEFIAEMAMFAIGVPIGYGSPFTMTDFASGLAAGQKGDMPLLRPTVFPGVPLVLERIQRQVMGKVEKRFIRCSKLIKEMLNVVVNYKNQCLERGVSTPMIDRFIAKQFNAPFGGRLAYMMIGGAPLSCETQRFVRSLMNVKILIGYGATETCGANLVADTEDISLGWSGAPLYGVRARLVDWTEGGYTTTDRPYPRGELHIGGSVVSSGYYNQSEMTTESFYLMGGLQWFRTGDIAQVNEQGLFKIIDRKKDLVKLQHGEYVSFGTVETALRNFGLIDNVCVYGDSTHSHLIAIILPDWKVLAEVAKKWDKIVKVEPDRLRQLCGEASFVASIKKQLETYCIKETKLSKFEIPHDVILCTEEWTPDNEMVTAAMKIKRYKIYQHYKPKIDQVFASSALLVRKDAAVKSLN